MKNFARSLAITSVVALTSLTAIPAFAYDVDSTASVNIDASGVGLKGFDPVSYFSVGMPIVGDTAYTADFDGVTYQFASIENRDRFRGNPAAYVPAYGGFCQTGAMVNKKLDVDPTIWRVADGVLYLYISEPAKETFLKDVLPNTETANANWPEIRDLKPADL